MGIMHLRTKSENGEAVARVHVQCCWFLPPRLTTAVWPHPSVPRMARRLSCIFATMKTTKCEDEVGKRK